MTSGLFVAFVAIGALGLGIGAIGAFVIRPRRAEPPRAIRASAAPRRPIPSEVQLVDETPPVTLRTRTDPGPPPLTVTPLHAFAGFGPTFAAVSLDDDLSEDDEDMPTALYRDDPDGEIEALLADLDSEPGKR
ncbi:MAG: hypothetical protein ABMB14_20205 [Myxococcota bacterium]